MIPLVALAPLAPDAHASPPDPDAQACAAVRKRGRDELCDPDAPPGATCAADTLPCAHTLDLDGDGRPERVGFAAGPAAVGLRVRWGDGRQEIVGRFNYEIEPGHREERTDLSWIVGWKVIAKGKGAAVLGSMVPIPGDAKGDALWMTGTDAAALFVYTDEGWWLRHLGY